MLSSKIKFKDGRVVMKDAKTTHKYKGYVLEWDNEDNKVPAKIISPAGKVIFTYSAGSLPTISGFNAKVDADLSK